MKFRRYDPSYESYDTWKSICSEGAWKKIEPNVLSGLIPSGLLNKTNGVLVMASGSPQASAFVANLNRVDMLLRAKLNEHEMAGINGTGRSKKEARAGLIR